VYLVREAAAQLALDLVEALDAAVVHHQELLVVERVAVRVGGVAERGGADVREHAG